MEQMMKGIALKGIVDLVREAAGPEGVEALAGHVSSVNYSASQKYPATIASNLVKEAVKVVFGSDSDENEIQFGKLTSKKFTDMAIGKTMFALMGNNPKIIISGISRIVGTGIEGFSIKTESIDDHTVRIISENDPFPICHSVGIFSGILEGLGKKPSVSYQAIGDKKYEMVVAWS